MFTQEHGSFPITFTKNSIVIIVDYTSHAMFCQALLYDLFVFLTFLFIFYCLIFLDPLPSKNRIFCENVLNKYPFDDIMKIIWNQNTLRNKHKSFVSKRDKGGCCHGAQRSDADDPAAAAGHVVFTWKKAGADFYLRLGRIFDCLFYFPKLIVRAVFQSSCYPVRCFIANRKKSHAAVWSCHLSMCHHCRQRYHARDTSFFGTTSALRLLQNIHADRTLS